MTTWFVFFRSTKGEAGRDLRAVRRKASEAGSSQAPEASPDLSRTVSDL